MTNTSPHAAKFLKRYPGPFIYERGSDGVDNTFDILCDQTGKHVASTFYWDARVTSELNSHVITSLLNGLLSREKLSYNHPRLSSFEIDAFRGMHPGPYRSAKTHCDYRGPGYEVRSESDGHCVLFVYDRSFRGQARLVTAQVAELLNAEAFPAPTPVTVRPGSDSSPPETSPGKSDAASESFINF